MRTLTLIKDTIGELTPADLRTVVGAAGADWQGTLFDCMTGVYPTLPVNDCIRTA